MNRLVVGTDKSEITKHLPDAFLFIDDDISTVPLPPRRKVTKLDLSHHSYNPLRDIDYKRAKELIAVLDAVFPEGEDTLTKKASNFVLLNALLSGETDFQKLISTPSIKDTGKTDAYQKFKRSCSRLSLRTSSAVPQTFL